MLADALLCLIVGVADGQTLTAHCHDGTLRQSLHVRIAAVAAPPGPRPYGASSRAALSALCLQQQATLRPQAPLRPGGALVADVECRDMDAAAALVRAGMARMLYRDAPGRGYLRRAEDAARGERLGLWAQEPLGR